MERLKRCFSPFIASLYILVITAIADVVIVCGVITHIYCAAVNVRAWCCPSSSSVLCNWRLSAAVYWYVSCFGSCWEYIICQQEIRSVELGVCPMHLFHFFVTSRSSSSKSAALYKISSKSDDFSPRYGDITIFKMAAVRHLEFLKFSFTSSFIRVKKRRACLRTCTPMTT